MPSAFQLACQPIPTVRIALIGLGQRGMKTLQRYAFIQGAEFRYVADLCSKRTNEANKVLVGSGRSKAQELVGKEAWKEACQKEDVDLVYICTEWNSHTMMAVEAMLCGKHVAVEVPAATNVSDCWKLVRTAEKTQRHCFMTENCCYDFFALGTLEMNRLGLLGEITHCEGAYIHNLASYGNDGQFTSETHRNWMESSCSMHGGNPYPTHAIGPIAQLLGFHRSDRMLSITSLTARGVAGKQGLTGRVNTSLIQTENGVSIMLQLDVSTPRPYSRLQTVCGSMGYVQKYPLPTIQYGGREAYIGDEALKEIHKYATSEQAQLWNEGHRCGVDNEMNYAMDARLIYCLRHGLPLDIDVYDAAEWSCLAELSQRSARLGGMPVAIPDFLSGE